MKVLNLTAVLVVLTCTATVQAQGFPRFGFAANNSAANNSAANHDDFGDHNSPAPIAMDGAHGGGFDGANFGANGGCGARGDCWGRGPSCCDNIWSGYCGQKRHGCQRPCQAKTCCGSGAGCGDACGMNDCGARGCGKHGGGNRGCGHRGCGGGAFAGPACGGSNCFAGPPPCFSGCPKNCGWSGGCGGHHKMRGFASNCGGGCGDGGWFGGSYATSFMNTFGGNFGHGCGCGPTGNAGSADVSPDSPHGPALEPAPTPAPLVEPIPPAPPQPTNAPASAAGKSAQNWIPGRMIGNAFSF